MCFLAGLRVTAPDMKASADAYFDAQQLMDLRIASTLGLTEDDITALGEEEVLDILRSTTVESLTPIQAMNLLYELKGKL